MKSPEYYMFWVKVHLVLVFISLTAGFCLVVFQPLKGDSRMLAGSLVCMFISVILLYLSRDMIMRLEASGKERRMKRTKGEE